MVYRGKVQNGQIVIEGGARLPEGIAVDIRPVESPARGTIGAILATNAHWHGTDEELRSLLADLKESKRAEVERTGGEPEPPL
jgi:hypothetical protein